MKQLKDKIKIIYIIQYQLTPMKDSLVYYELGCKECCILPHSTRRHKEIPSKKLKNQIDQFTALDDWLWEEAIGVQHKLQQLELGIRKLREQTMQQIYDKKLSYALAWDKADDIEKSFKLARDGEWRKLTCNNIFRIQEKIQRGRKIQEKDVKKLTRQIVEQAQKSVEALVKSCFNNNQRRYEDRRQIRREQERPRRQERARMDPPKNEAPSFKNDYPLVKINKVTQIDTHFNIVLKVIKLHKQFRINGSNKLQILCGDETGTAVAVIDYYSFIKAGIVISISNARIYSFHGSKQIQCSNRNSQVKQERIIINQVNQKYNLSGARRGNNNNDDDRRPRRREEEGPRRREEERRPREDKPREEREKQDRPRREVRQNRDSRPYRVDRNAATYQEQLQRPPRREREREEPVKTERRYQRRQQQKPARISREDRSQVRSRVDRENSRINRKQQLSSSSSQDEVEQQEPKIQKNASSQKQNNTKFTKIQNIEPGDEELTIIAEIYELQIQGPTPQKGHFLSHIGDDTGIIRMQLPKSNLAIKEGAVIKIVNVNADVDPRDHRLTLKLADDGFCDKTDIKMPKLKIDNNMSTNQWESDGEEQEKEAIIEDL